MGAKLNFCHHDPLPPLHALQPPPNPFLSNEAAVAGGKEGERDPEGREALGLDLQRGKNTDSTVMFGCCDNN